MGVGPGANRCTAGGVSYRWASSAGQWQETVSGLGPQSALETLAVGVYSCGFRVSLWARAWHWKLVTGIGPGSCRCTAGAGSPQSTYSSGGQLLASRLVPHTHTVAEASAGYQDGSHVCWGKGREGLEREQGESWCLQMEKSLGGTSVVRSIKME